MMGHFQEMLDLGEELGDPNIIALAQIHRADVLRKRGRHEAAVRTLNATNSIAENADPYIQGVRWQILARTHFAFGYKDLFLIAIDNAEDIATNIKETIDTQYNQFNLVQVLQERAQGYTMLWLPEKALEIYNRVRLFLMRCRRCYTLSTSNKSNSSSSEWTSRQSTMLSSTRWRRSSSTGVMPTERAPSTSLT